jgi:membrane protein DedA with SNARE-associated domain
MVFTVTGYLTWLAMCFWIGYELGHVWDLAAALVRVFASTKAAERALVAVVSSLERRHA